MEPPRLIYFADPMCSWCWGFSPVVAATAERWGEALPVRLVMGGLRPGQTEPMSAAARRELRGHWAEVTAASGQPFDRSVVDGEGFVYDTHPAARAVILARREGAAAALAYLSSAHRAFYVEGRDITEAGVLADIAAELGHAREAFLRALGEETLNQETWSDYGLSQRAGVRGFPTLVVGPMSSGEYAPITRGFMAATPVLASIDAWMADHGAHLA